MEGRVYLSPPDLRSDELRLIIQAIESGWIAPVGPDLDAFEAEFAEVVGTSHAVGLSSGTAALHLALLILGVRPGDDVIVSTFTFVASVNAITYVGARPVLLDSEPTTWNLSPDLLAEEFAHRSRLGRLPAAVIAVDLYGQCCDYERIAPLCENYGVNLIEDATEALGALWNGTPAGQFGAVAAFSFNGNKIITTSGGGMLVTSDETLAARARHLATQARDPAIHYEHSELGYNYRLSNLLAALGRGQLRTLGDRVKRRRAFFERYSSLLSPVPGVEFQPEAERSNSTRWLTCCTIDPKDAGFTADSLLQELGHHNIESRPTWKPMHLQPLYSAAPSRIDGTSERIFRNGLCLPSGSGMSDADFERVISVISDFIQRSGAT